MHERAFQSTATSNQRYNGCGKDKLFFINFLKYNTHLKQLYARVTQSRNLDSEEKKNSKTKFVIFIVNCSKAALVDWFGNCYDVVKHYGGNNATCLELHVSPRFTLY